MPQQRYISNELTHFLGGSEREKGGNYEGRQYSLLQTILSTGCLKSKNSPDCNDQRHEFVESFTEKFSSNKKFDGEWVCFCDIPVPDFGIHMVKYSRFGIAFEKEFLASKGANPVFYIANSSTIGFVPRQLLFDNIIEGELRKLRSLNAALSWNRGKGLSLHSEKGEIQNLTPDQTIAIRDFLTLLQLNVFSYAKFFDLGTDDAETNYYMEREWRLIGSLKFEMSDVSRIILPKEYSSRLRHDFPEFTGQVSFAE